MMLGMPPGNSIMASQFSITLNPLPCKEKRLLAAVLVLVKKVISQESVDTAVQHGIYVPTFAARAVILDQTIRLQRIGAYLTAEGYGVLPRIVGLTRGVALALFIGVKTRFQHTHGDFTITLL